MPTEPIRLAVPARREALGVIRTVAAGIANLQRFGLDRIEDIRLAVSEAASLLVRDGVPTRLECSITTMEQGLEVELSGLPAPGTWPPNGWDDSLERVVLTATTNSVDLTSSRIRLGLDRV